MGFRNTSDYTPIAPHYDATRNIPYGLLQTCFKRIFAQAGFYARGRILDAGCGTAQVSLPLIKNGHSVVGVDVSPAMLEVARKKLAPGDTAEFKVADVRSLEDPDSSYDGVVVSKLFQHVGNWQSAVDELLRVTKDGGLFMHINERGAFKHAVRRQFSARCQEQGYTDLYVGIKDRSQLAGHLMEKGAAPLAIDMHDLIWEKTITYATALEHLRLKLHSEFWAVPDEVYAHVLEEVRAWVRAQPGGEDTVETMRPYLVAEVFTVRK
ncbi:MAG: class I SAM-dependent methyltransferase [Chloroflexota bacterium]|nr:class I SAM-dependent methyltransferase [Chloroflexota bacterium]MDE2839903.1 class I SAM-dependent methyltransferase [Chloroflexota bacterium]MDE2931319.1 class I SAM-dependent methyltransferase [Chloroflexota bacterium]